MTPIKRDNTKTPCHTGTAPTKESVRTLIAGEGPAAAPAAAPVAAPVAAPAVAPVVALVVAPAAAPAAAGGEVGNSLVGK